MTIERIGCGPRMSDAVVHGETVYLAGHVADAAKGRGVGEQTADILTQIDETLARAGSNKSKILQATIYLANIATFQEMNAVWDKWVMPGHTPARATVEARLAAPAYAVEIVVIAAR